SAAKQIQENKYAAIKYNVEKERKKRQAAELQNEREKRYKILFIAAFLIAFLLGAFLLHRKTQQRKKAIIHATQKTEARISKRIHDDLANDISGVMSLVANTLNTSTTIKDDLLNFLNDIYLRARDISIVYAGIDVNDFPKALKNLIAQHHQEGVTILTAPYSTINWDALAEYKKKAIYKSLQELLVNTKKHSKAKLVTIAFHGKGKKNEIVYSDDGVGFDPDEIVMGGLRNVETRINDIGGSFSFESKQGQGFKATLYF
ncbi:MAG: ATP-binding protein, partial [Bacteroidota bacterium]